METLTVNHLDLPLGTTQDQTPLSLNLAASPHTMVIGGTSTGRCHALRHLAQEGLEHGLELVIIDPIRRGFGFERVADRATLAHTMGEAIEALKGLAAELPRRIDLLLASGASTVRDLPASEAPRPILVLIDEYATIATRDPLPRGLDERDALYAEAQEYNAQAEKIRHLTAMILRRGRSAGIHLAIGTQRAVFSAVVPENVGNVIMTVGPSAPITPAAAAVACDGVTLDGAAVQAALDEAMDAKGRCHAVLVTESAATAFQFPRPAEA